MTESSHPKLPHDDWNALLAGQKAREDARRMELTKLVALTPVSDEVLKEIAWLGPSHQKAVLAHHPGEGIARKIASLWTVLEVFELACTDLQAQLGNFNTFSLKPEMGTSRGRHALLAIEISVKKELMAFSVAASALVEHTRRANKAAPVAQFDEQRIRIFDGPEHRFVTSVRNLISHESFPDVDWQIQHRERRTTDFTMSSSALLTCPGLNKEAKQFIESCGNQIYVSRITKSYSARVREFYAWYKQALEEALPPALADYRRIAKQCQIVSHRNWYRFLVHWAISAKVDPYKRLDGFLVPEQVSAALRMERGSSEQVDFIIAAADEYGACDDGLRTLVYQLFRMPGYGDSSPS